MASHARPPYSRVPRALLRAGLAVSAAGAALAAGTASSAAAGVTDSVTRGADPSRVTDAVSRTPLSAPTSTVSGPLQVLGSTLDQGVSPVTSLRLDPLAGTTTDPLSNSVGTTVADFKPISTKAVTDPLTSGGSLRDLPLVHQVGGLLGH